MASGFPGAGGGDPGFYSGGGRSIGGPTNIGYMDNFNGVNNNNVAMYRFQHQQRLMALDRSAQIGYRSPDLLMLGKRSLAEFQTNYSHPQQHNHNLFMRSMKQRIGGFQSNHALSPISPLSPSIHLSSQDQDQSMLSSVSSLYKDSGPTRGSDNNNNKVLQELEKQLFDDDAEADNDPVSGIANNEWSQTFHDLLSPNPTITTASTTSNNISPSPASSSCNSSKTPPPPPEIISEAASAITDGKAEQVSEALSRLAQVASPTGEPEQRLAFHMLNALRCRVSPGENPPPVAELYSSDHQASLHALYDLSPCFSSALLSSNLLILEAIASTMQESNATKVVPVHIIDFDIGHGQNYAELLPALMERALPNGPPLQLKITAVETDKEAASKRLEAVRDRLMRFANSDRLSLRFNSVTSPVDELTRESIGCDPDETLVASLAFWLHRVPDESVCVENPRDELLRRVRAMKPRVVTLVEQELSSNTAPLAARVADCVGYYGAVMESLEQAPERARVEEALARKMANAVACEGRDRVERCEVFGKWRARMCMAGFKIKPVGHGVADSMRADITARHRNANYTVKVDNGGVCFGWMGRTLTVASAWH